MKTQSLMGLLLTDPDKYAEQIKREQEMTNNLREMFSETKPLETAFALDFKKE